MAFILNNWSKIADPAPWAKRYVHRSLSQGGYIWMCGGYLPETVARANDVWKSVDGINWTQVVEHAEWPGRSAHGFIYFNNKFWVMGGYDGALDNFVNDVWCSDDGLTWTFVTNAPWSVRHEFTVTIFQEEMWVIGGYNTEYPQYKDDIWSTPDGLNWTQKSFLPWGSGGVREHASASFLGKLWVLGGENESNISNNIYSSPDGTNWTLEALPSWSERREHQVVISEDGLKIAIIGGFDRNGNFLNDVWDSTDGTSWTKITQFYPYTARSDFALVNHLGTTYLFGGAEDFENFNDVWSTATEPTVNFTSDVTQGNSPFAVQFYDISSIALSSRLWDFGDGQTSTDQNPVHIYTATGFKTVSLTGIYINANFFWEDNSGNHINENPFDLSDQPIKLTPEDVVGDHTWGFGDGTTGYGSSIEHSYPVPLSDSSYQRVYHINHTYTNDDSNTASYSVDMTVFTPPVVNFYSATDGTTVTFVDTSIYNPTTWDWTFGDGSYSTLQNPIHNYAAYDASYTVTLFADTSVGRDSTTGVVVTASPEGPTLIGWWKGEDSTIDSVNGNDASWEWVAPRYVDGYIGRAFDVYYDPAARVKLPDVPILDFGVTSQFTIEFYLYLSHSDEYSNVSVDCEDDVSTTMWSYLIRDPVNGPANFYTPGGGNVDVTISNWLDDQWNKIKFTHNNTIWNIYNNDVLIQTIPSATMGVATNKNIYFGYSSSFGGGYVDELKIYSGV